MLTASAARFISTSFMKVPEDSPTDRSADVTTVFVLTLNPFTLTFGIL